MYRKAFRNAVNGPASLDAYNGELQDLQDELNNSLAKNGSTPMTGSLKFQGFKIDLDADTDTSIDASTDDQIDFEINGSDVLPLTAAKATALDAYSAASDEANVIVYATASNAYAESAITSIGRAIIGCDNAGEVFDVLETGGFGMVLLDTKTASNSATIDFTSNIDPSYKEYAIHFLGVTVTAASSLRLRTSTDGGATFDSGAAAYSFTVVYGANIFAGTETHMTVCETGISDTVYSGAIQIIQPSNAAYCQINGSGVARNATINASIFETAGQRSAAADVNAIRLYASAGNLISGKFKLYGIA